MMQRTLQRLARTTRLAAGVILASALSGTAFAQMPVTVGDSMSTSYNYEIPVNNLYNYSYTQQILLASDIGLSGPISTIRFKYNTGSLSSNDNWTVYLGYKTGSSFTSNTDWVPLSGLTQVFSGTVTAADGWITLALTTPFNYNMANGNLVVAVDENAPSYTYTSNMFPTNSSGTDNRAIYYRADGTNPDPATPPTASGRLAKYNTVQLMITGTPCSGTPTAALTSAVTNACAGTPFLLTASPSGETGLTYLFEVSTDGGTTWSNVAPAGTSAAINVTQSEESQYRVTVTCSGGTPSVSSVVTVNQNAPTDCYCTPTTSNGATSYISNFTTTGGIVNIDNTSTGNASGYSDHHLTDSAKAMPGSTISYSMAVSTTSTYGRAIWIDYNEDGIFQPAERVAFSGSYVGGAWTGSFTVPATVAPGTKRMRVVATLSISNPSDPCLASGSSGEYEDYAFVVAPLPACTGAPAPGATYASSTTTCYGNSINLGVENNPLVTGLSYAWYQSTDGGATWTEIAGATDSTYSAMPEMPTLYRALATCATGGDTASSTPIAIGFNANIDSVQNAAICPGGMATLSAFADSALMIYWYDAATSGTLLDSGAIFTTPALSTTTTYYAQATTMGPESVTIGAGSAISNSGSPGYTGQSPFSYHYGNYKHQMLVLGSELAAEGLLPGDITSLSFVVTGPSGSGGMATFNDFTVSLKNTTATELTTTFESGTTVVWNGNYTPDTGVNTILFTVPFVWDGSSNVVVQTCYHNDNSGAVALSAEVEVDPTSFPSHSIFRKDSATPDICDQTTATGGSDQLINNRPKMIFGANGNCSGPLMAVTVAVSEPGEAGTIVADETAAPMISFSTTGTAGAETYAWDFGDGATATTETASHTYTANGTYTVTFVVTDSCGTSDTTTTTVEISGLGINAVQTGGQIAVYPNPASNLTVVDGQGSIISSLEVMDNLGRVILRQQPNAEKATLDVKGMAHGIYTIRVQTNKGLSTVKLVVGS